MIDWPSTRVVVTGGTGFLGSHLVDELKARGGANVFAADSAWDLRSASTCVELFRSFSPDIVFHLAARVGGIGANQAAPGKMLFDNAMMSLQLLETCRAFRIKKTVLVGSICAYPANARMPLNENDLWAGYPEPTNAPYGIAKRLLLEQSKAYRAQYGLNSIMLFPTNIYGPRDNFDLQTSHVIPAIIRKCIEARENSAPEIWLWGDGSPTREFIYVTDVVDALIRAAERYDSSDPVNIGTGVEIEICALAHRIAKLAGFSGRIVWDHTKPNGQARRWLCVDRARDFFGFESTTSLDDGLKKTIAWYEENRR